MKIGVARILPFCLSFLCFASFADADAEKVANLDKLMSAYHQENLFNGFVLVAQKGEVLFQKGYGYADMSWEEPCTPDTAFRLASVSKQFAAALVMQCVERGELKLDDTICDHLDYYRRDTGEKITIHHLLSHTSGLPNYTAFPGMYDGPHRQSYTVKDFVLRFCSRDLEFEPGTKYEYCNSGYYLVGAILEQATGKKFADLVKERIFDPVGMTNSGYDDNSHVIPHFAEGYVLARDGYRLAGYQDMSIYHAAGALYSTPADMHKWDRALYTEDVLSSASIAKLHTPNLEGYGYGWNITEEKDLADGRTLTRYSHSGYYGGYNNLVTRYIDDQWVVLLFNNTNKTELTQIRNGIAHILYGKPYDLPLKMLPLTSGEGPGSVSIARISSQGTIRGDDATFHSPDAGAGSTIYNQSFLIYDGEHAYWAGSTGGETIIRDGEVAATANSIDNAGMTFTKTPGLRADFRMQLAPHVAGASSDFAATWEFHNVSDKEIAVRLLWFIDADIYFGSTGSGDDLVRLLRDSGNALVLGDPGGDPSANPGGDGKPAPSKSLTMMTDAGVAATSFGIVSSNGASKYWSSGGSYSEIGPAAAGYRLPDSVRNTVESDADGDGVSDAGNDVAGAVEVSLTLAPGATAPATFRVRWGETP